MEQMKLSYVAGGHIKWYGHSGDHTIAVSYKDKHTRTM